MGRGLEWPQCLNCLFDCSLIVCVSANFLIFLLLILLSVVLSPLLLARSPKYPQRITVASAFEMFFACLLACLLDCLEANFLIFLLLILLSVVPSPLLLARSLEYPQRIRVVSVFELYVCLLDCSLSA